MQILRLRSATLVGSVFVTAFYSADYLASIRHSWVDLSLPFEPVFRHTPLPNRVHLSVYMSAFPFVALLLWQQHAAWRLLHWQRAMLFAIAIATPTFVLFPTAPLFPNHPQPWSDHLTIWLERITGRHNHFPSLHVGFTLVSLLTLARELRAALRWLVWFWGAIIILSTLYTWQHCLADVLGGLILGYVAVAVNSEELQRY